MEIRLCRDSSSAKVSAKTALLNHRNLLFNAVQGDMMSFKNRTKLDTRPFPPRNPRRWKSVLTQLALDIRPTLRRPNHGLLLLVWHRPTV